MSLLMNSRSSISIRRLCQTEHRAVISIVPIVQKLRTMLRLHLKIPCVRPSDSLFGKTINTLMYIHK